MINTTAHHRDKTTSWAKSHTNSSHEMVNIKCSILTRTEKKEGNKAPSTCPKPTINQTKWTFNKSIEHWRESFSSWPAKYIWKAEMPSSATAVAFHGKTQIEVNLVSRPITLVPRFFFKTKIDKNNEKKNIKARSLTYNRTRYNNSSDCVRPYSTKS